MTTPPAQPRIPPLPPAERDERARDLLADVGPLGSDMNIFATLVRHPRIFRRWSPFGGVLLLGGSLPARDRELLILRTAWNNGCEYEWSHHVSFGADAGLGEEIDRVALGPEAPGWSPFEVTLLRAADDLHHDSVIGEATWRALEERYDERQLIEVPMLVGHYTLLAFTLNSLGVQREEGLPSFPTSRNTGP